MLFYPSFLLSVSPAISKTEKFTPIFENGSKLKCSDYLHPPLYSLLYIYSLLYPPRQQGKTQGNDIK